MQQRISVAADNNRIKITIKKVNRNKELNVIDSQWNEDEYSEAEVSTTPTKIFKVQPLYFSLC